MRKIKKIALNIYELIFLLVFPTVSIILMWAGKLSQKKLLEAFFVFCVIYGFTFNIFSDDMDAFRYVQQMSKNISLFQMYGYWSGFVQILTGRLDFLIYLIIYNVGIVFNNKHILFAVFALFFSIFYIFNLKNFLKYSNESIFSSLLVLTFGMIVWVHEINIVRFWLSTTIVLSAVLMHVEDNRKSMAIALFLLALIVHWAGMVYLLTYIFWRFSKQMPFLLFLTLIFSLIIRFWFSDSALGTLGDFLSYDDTLLSDKAETYYSVTVNGIAKNRLQNFIIQRFLSLNSLFQVLIIVMYMVRRKKVKFKELSYFTLSFAYFAVSNFLMVISSGERFVRLPIFFALFVIIINIRNIPRVWQLVISVPLIIFSLLQFRAISFSYSLEQLISPLIMVFGFSELSIRDFTF